MKSSAIIQARMGSNRLPGKVVLPLDGIPAIKQLIRRTAASSIIDDIIVATTFHARDDLIEQYAKEEGAKVYRGSEDDVLGRLHRASKEAEHDVIVRLTGDNPLVPPVLMDLVGETVLKDGIDYASNKIDRTFPIGADAEALTFDSLSTVHRITNHPYHREHATKYFREVDNEFNTRNITVNDTYGKDISILSPDIRLTLDEVSDYNLFRNLYNDISYDKILDFREAVEYMVENDLQKINQNVEQKTL